MSEEIKVLPTDLEIFKTAINTAYYKSLAEDMGRSYSSLSQSTSECALTKLLGQALSKVDVYLEEKEEEE